MITSVFIILLMLLLSAFFSGMEIAFTSKNRLKLEIDRKQSRLFNFIADIFARHPGSTSRRSWSGIISPWLSIRSICRCCCARSRRQWVGRRSLAAGPSFWKRRFRQSSSSSSPNFSRNPFSGTARILLPPVCSCDLFLLSAAFSDRQADDLDFPGDFVADGA